MKSGKIVQTIQEIYFIHFKEVGNNIQRTLNGRPVIAKRHCNAHEVRSPLIL